MYSFKYLLERPMPRRYVLKFIAVSPFLGLAACAPRKPEAIRYDEDICENCQMMMSDPRYGSELISNTGKLHKFDSVECLIAYVIKNSLSDNDIQSLWVTDFENQAFIQAENGFYLQSIKLRSPMIVGLTAFASETARDAAWEIYDGSKLSYSDLARVVKEARFA